MQPVSRIPVAGLEDRILPVADVEVQIADAVIIEPERTAIELRFTAGHAGLPGDVGECVVAIVV